jgi:hypothetical protein
VRRGTLAISWGRWGGVYVHRRRLCLGWVAITLLPMEIEDLMRAYTEHVK